MRLIPRSFFWRTILLILIPLLITQVIIANVFFGNHWKRVHATLANQLALFVVLYSPLQMACDLPENYMLHPDMFAFIRRVPCDWEQSRFLDGKIGDYVVMARQERGTEDWFVGAVTDENSRDITLTMDFLKPDVTYEMTVYADGEDADWKNNPSSTHIYTRTVRAQDTLQLHLASGGGCAIHICPKAVGGTTSKPVKTDVENVPFEVAKNYFFKNNQEIPTSPKITTAEAFNQLFGMAAFMGKNGMPTPIDFDKQFVLAIVLPVTNVATEIIPQKVEVKGNQLFYSYEVKTGKQQSFSIQPVSIIILDKQFENHEILLAPKSNSL